jgi:uncharacterized lipoprotein YddW (UPF0748 family)
MEPAQSAAQPVMERPEVAAQPETEPAQQPVLEPVPPAGSRRGLWVLCEGSQRVLENPDQIPVLLADAEALGVTDLFVQVYRGGRAWFPSTRADASRYERVAPSGGQDALGLLLEKAHARGLRVHAWVNVLSLADNAQAEVLQALGRDVAMVDQHGRSVLDYPGYEVPEPDRSYYRMGTPAVWLDPAAPGVAEYLGATFEELLRNVPELDGLHLDYIRYADALPFTPGTRFGVGLHFGFGEATRARFARETGLAAPYGESMANATRFDRWRREQLTTLVASIASRARAARPGLEVSAAVISDRERAYLVDLQDWLGWLDQGHLDFAVPMLYTLDPLRLRYGMESFSGLARPGGRAPRNIWVGLGSWLFAGNPAGGVAQLRETRAAPELGSALFSWDALREEPELLNALATEAVRERTRAAR